LTAELIAEGFLFDEGSVGARHRNTGLSLNRDAGVAIGVELFPDECRGVLTNMAVRVLTHRLWPLPSCRVEDTVAGIVALAKELRAGTDQSVLGLTVAVPGPTDRQGQRVVYSESLGWYDVPLADRLQEQLQIPVTVINRPKAGVLGEYWYGAGIGVDNLVYLSVSTGVAAGILIGGELFNGDCGCAGEIGHTAVHLEGAPCACGNSGCLEMYASVPAIIRGVEVRLAAGEPSVLTAGTRLAFADLMAAARDGDNLVIEEVKRASRYVGLAVAGLINLFNPRMVVVGGRLADAGEVMLATIQETAKRRAYPLGFSGAQIVRSALGPDSVCTGACALVVDRFLAQAKPGIRRAVHSRMPGDSQ
jgi:glucokinase-like ROK family protein